MPGYLWRGWLPIPGHLEWRVGWYTKTVGMTIRVSRYIPRRKITYYTYKLEPDAPTGKYINLGKPVKYISGMAAWYQGVQTTSGSAAVICLQPEVTPLAYISLSWGIFEIGYGINQVWDAADDPLYSNKNYEDQIHEDWPSWFL